MISSPTETQNKGKSEFLHNKSKRLEVFQSCRDELLIKRNVKTAPPDRITLKSPFATYCPPSLSLLLSSDWRLSPRTDVWRMTEASLGRGGTTGGVSS